MKLIRYIHPIGQGAFYTEQFFDDNNVREPYLASKNNSITMFQIPHHASQVSFDLGILDLLKHTPSSLVMFASCGNKNTYGHPSPYVITQCYLFLRDHTKSLKAHEHNIDFITEQRVRIVTE